MLNNDYKEMLQCLLEENVRFLLISAYAVVVYGYPRATKDRDLFVRATPVEEELKKAALDYHCLPTPRKISLGATKARTEQRDLSLALIVERAPDLAVEGEIRTDPAVSKTIRDNEFPDSRLTAAANRQRGALRGSQAL